MPMTPPRTWEEEKKGAGGSDFEASTEGVHQGPGELFPGEPRCLGPREEFAGAERTTPLGTQSRANLSRGGSPQHGSLGKPPHPLFLSRSASHSSGRRCSARPPATSPTLAGTTSPGSS